MAFVLQRYRRNSSKQSSHLRDLFRHWTAKSKSRFPLLWLQDANEKPGTPWTQLQGTTALEAYDFAAQGVAREFQELLSVVCPRLAGRRSLQDYQEVWALVNSHVVTYPGGDSPESAVGIAQARQNILGPQSALIPIFDLVNHHLAPPDQLLRTDTELWEHHHGTVGRYGIHPPTPGSVGQEPHAQMLHLWADRQLKRGEEITDVYGIKSNEESLWTWGFTLPWIHNLTCLSRTRLSLQVAELPGSGQQRPGFGHAGLLPQLQPFLSFSVKPCSLHEGSSDHGLLQIIAFARSWYAAASASSPQALRATCGFQGLGPLGVGEAGSSSGWQLAEPCAYLSMADELAALRVVSAAVTARQAGLAGGRLEEDEQLLQGGAFQDLAVRDALVVRRDEKYVLRHLGLWLRSREKSFKSSLGKPGVSRRRRSEL
ncbi:unnamed protein product [Polarella glacialis]|uniref:SET domain-containing protein n=1 Tax=Polarella glacialis TaxID=89957 RepID=A0A813FN26_POLGL|nr:unnamed protein product [Polarella glacialis]